MEHQANALIRLGEAQWSEEGSLVRSAVEIAIVVMATLRNEAGRLLGTDSAVSSPFRRIRYT